jgi:poly(3-hydroxyalkanoate) synthetase
MLAANHSFYLREFYGENRLAKGELALPGSKSPSSEVAPSIDDITTTEDHIVFYFRGLRGKTQVAPVELTPKSIKLNLKKVKLPIYELAMKEDHIAPAASVFKGSRLFGGQVEFVLSGSGHIAGPKR